ncbi:AzlC family ABC transporter permease [Acinetobacter sp. MB5]|uniref:AzlC family ABC transporter permease n=1 Tax=Acinetobacter sp. MB5 TaxID=2069438 RepID=UPI000DCFD0DC|nr:AzlC family ABC transporter permease [Acinetobacter sp. MB5]
MRISNSISRLPSATLRAIFFVCIATGMVGVSLGSLASSYHVPLWIPLSLSICVLAGTAEFIFIGFLITGGHPITAAITGLLVNLRHLPFGIAVHELIQGKFLHFFGCHIMNDESVMFGLTQENPEYKKLAYWVCGICIMLCWPLGVFMGYFIGKIIPSPSSFGLDTLFPAILFALIWNQLRDSTSIRQSALIGSGLTIGSVSILPMGLPILVSLLGLFFARKK